MKVFISHITEEAPLALVLKKLIETKFVEQISVFASSDVHDLTPGVKWMRKIEAALMESDALLVICSPSSLTRPWINFEAGCGWIKGIEIIPICHSGQRKDQLPYPFSELQALQLDDQNFGNALLATLSKHLQIKRTPTISSITLQKRLKKATIAISVPEASPQIIHSSQERTKLINNDLETLLNSKHVCEETVWTSAFLSTLSIGPDDPYSPDQRDYLDLLLKERELLLTLARKGCMIKCIISPANKNYHRHSGTDFAIQRTKRLIELINSGDTALNHIDWAISELGTKNLYIIGRISCFEGYKKGIQRGYELTIRQTSHSVINANTDVYSGFFKDLAARSLARWTNEHDQGYGERDLLRIAASRCLEQSLDFLMDFAASINTKSTKDKCSRKPAPKKRYS